MVKVREVPLILRGSSLRQPRRSRQWRESHRRASLTQRPSLPETRHICTPALDGCHLGAASETCGGFTNIQIRVENPARRASRQKPAIVLFVELKGCSEQCAFKYPHPRQKASPIAGRLVFSSVPSCVAGSFSIHED